MLTVLGFSICVEQRPRTSQSDLSCAGEGVQTVRTQDLNRPLGSAKRFTRASGGKLDLEYRIGPQDLLDINIFEAPELNGPRRVSANGEISMPLVGNVDAVGLTARELEAALGSDCSGT